MTTLAGPKLITADELFQLSSDGVHAELIQGVLHETMPPGIEHGEIIGNLFALMWMFINPHKLGRLATSDPGILIERNPDTVRAPDIAFFTPERMPARERVVGYSQYIPDLVVEVKSPNDSRQYVYDKSRMWLSHGVRLVWAVYPDTRTVEVHQNGAPVSVVTADGALDGGDVLPGFGCELALIFGPDEDD
jgi:Uma2 family endonuclease